MSAAKIPKTFILLLAAILIPLVWLLVGDRRATWQLAETSGSLRSDLEDFRDAEEYAFAETQRAVDNVFFQRDFLQEPLRASMLDVLQNGRAFFGRYVNRHAGDPSTRPACAKALYLLGRIAWEFAQMGDAEAAFRESRSLLDASPGGPSTAANQIGLMITNNALSCLLATLGDEEEAWELQSDIIRQLVESQSHASAGGMLALAHRNRGIVAFATGRDGLPDARRSVELARQQLGANNDTLVADEFLVDAYQILAALEWRRGAVRSAEEALLASIEALEELQAKIPALSERIGYTPPSLRYRRAAEMAKSNLARVQAHLAAGESAPVARSGWPWRPLQPRRGESLHLDLLVDGSLPAEFERHDGLLVTWLDRAWATDVLVQTVAATWRKTRIVILVPDDLVEHEARQHLEAAGVDSQRLRFFHLATDTPWARDWGPLVIRTGESVHQWVDAISMATLDFPRFLDDHVPTRLSQLVGAPVVQAPIFLHGGGLLGNGSNLCLVASSQLVWNAHLGIERDYVTSTLRRLTGATEIVYLEPLEGEPTEHVDWFATFTAPDVVVVGDYRGTDPINSPLLDRHAEALRGLESGRGPLQVHRIPMPPRGDDYFGGTYTNVVYANGTVLVPIWPDAAAENEEALMLFRTLLPEWEIVGIDCSQLVRREGALHCATSNLTYLPEVPELP